MSEPEFIAISSLARVAICPMQLYLERLSPEKFTEPIHYSIAKQIAIHLGDDLDDEKIWNEYLEIFPEKNFDAEKIFSEMILNAKKISWKKSEQLDLFVKSDHHKIFGRVDRVFSDGFSLVKSGEAPQSGIYSTDRVRMTAYTVCLDEMNLPSNGIVEYLGSGTVKNFSMTPTDMRKFQYTLNAVKKIQKNYLPKESSGSHCLKCRHHKFCRERQVPKTLLERMKEMIR